MHPAEPSSVWPAKRKPPCTVTDHANDVAPVFPRISSLLYMIVEHYKGDAVPVYRRFRDRGRLAPEGLRYISSWVTDDLLHCYQVMECDDPGLLDEWIGRWQDLVDFEVIPVVTSSEAVAAISPRI